VGTGAPIANDAVSARARDAAAGSPTGAPEIIGLSRLASFCAPPSEGRRGLRPWDGRRRGQGRL